MDCKPIFFVFSVLALAAACSTQTKLQKLKTHTPSAMIALSQDRKMPESAPRDIPQQDTLIIRNIDGRDMIIMRAIKDDDGQTVANQVLEAARVTARFRNVAERHGKVDLEFQIIVPEDLQDSKWQLRYDPVMHIMEDTVALDKVVITGRDYRKRQLRGYQQYQRFLSRIISDSTKLIHMEALEIFIRRNIPQLYAFRSDTTFVSDEQFNSVFGITERMAIDHYTDKFACRLNDFRIASKDRMYRKFVKAPIVSEGIRLDTVMMGEGGEYIYNYVQTIATRPGLKKAGIVLSGALYDQDRKLCDIAASDMLNFYISSLSAFVDDREKYITEVIERKAEANSAYDIAFVSGGSEIKPSLGENRSRIAEIRGKLRNLLLNDSFELDSVIVTATASPEGKFAYNEALSRTRGKNVAAYFEKYMRMQIDSVNREKGILLNLDSEYSNETDGLRPIPFTGRAVAEDWAGLDNLVETDSLMTEQWKKDYFQLRNIRNPDERENRMRGGRWYAYMRSDLYPLLRKVRFQFHLHRRGMTKDTIQTTILDSTYMEGIQAIKDRDYARAVELLMPYGDYNTAVAYCALDRNKNALGILSECEKTAQVNYMLALLYSREGDDRQAVEYYLQSCSQNPQYVHRGNLDPEISRLIKTYRLDEQTTLY